ncbi:MAG: hypothetical protein HW411_1172 [Gammaproteobacteria bacterium]|nr:hypothetical protein [Gammaproteobacteria bacterium]
MGLGTLNTILNTAPLIIQGAAKLFKIIKNRGESENKNDNIPATLDGLKKEIGHIHTRLDAHNESDLEQIKLIEELAKQNELLADSLKRSTRQLNVISAVAIIALSFCLFTMLYIVSN